jgi:hypothetical protein
MPKSIVLIYLFLSLFGNAQKHTYYLVGRPNSFSYNNALQEVADNYDLTFAYVLGDVYGESMSIEIVDYQKHNDSIITSICRSIPNCIDLIFEEANYEMIKQDSIRTIIYGHEDYLCKSGFLNETYLLFDKKSNKKQKYLIYLLGNRKSSTTRTIETIAKYSWNSGKLKSLNVKNNAIPECFSTKGLK